MRGAAVPVAFFALVLFVLAVGCSSGGDVRKGRTPNSDDDSDQSGVPASPSNLEATPEVDAIWLSWQDNSDDENGFRIYFKDATDEEGEFIKLAEVSANEVRYYHLTGPEQTYEYYITAFNEYGESEPSNTASAKTRPYEPPISYVECRCQGLEWCKIIVGWLDSKVDDGYELFIDGTKHCDCSESCLPCECSGGVAFGCWVATERFWPLTEHQVEVRVFNEAGEASSFISVQCPPP